MRWWNNFFLSSEDEEEEEEEEEEVFAKNDDDGISINRGKLGKNSRLGFYTKKKVHTKLCLHSIFTRKNNKARARGCSCVCVCV
jgi:hypothetical protein